MVIGIDGNEANVKGRVGVNEYAFQIIRNLRKLQEKGECQDCLIVYLKDKPLSDLPKETQKFKYKIIHGSNFWIIKNLMPYLFKNPDKIDILFSPSHYTPIITPMPRVCAIMDLGYLKYTEQFEKKVFWQLKWWSAVSILASKRIITISNSTKSDIVRHYPFSKQKVYVTYLGYDSKRFNSNISDEDVRRIRNKYSIVDDYILYLGTLKPSKNVEGLIDTFDKIRVNYPTLRLVIAGKKGWLYDSIYAKVKKLGLWPWTVQTGFIPEKDKPALIAGAKVFVLPSFWEGFGLDALYAMACGVPVVVSNVGSLPEVVGNAGILVDPNSIDSIGKGLIEVLSADKKKYNGISAAGVLQAREFSWEKTARQTLDILKNVNTKNN
ncbi:MAG: glycosyltransferase family 1 protein [Patescibacteria group bacterium]